MFDFFVLSETWNPRECEYCFDNYLLINEEGVTVKECHLTIYGLMCEECFSIRGNPHTLKSYKKGINIKNEGWYKRTLKKKKKGNEDEIKQR